MAATGLLLALVFRLPGASVGAGALGAGVLALTAGYVADAGVLVLNHSKSSRQGWPEQLESAGG